MSVTSRTAASIARHPTRTLGVLLIVALTLGIFLVLSQVSASVQGNANQAVTAVQNIVTVQLVGGSFGGGFFNFSIGAGVTPSAVNQIASTAGVASVQRITTQPEEISPGNPICGSSSDPSIQAMDTDGPIFLLTGGLGGATSVTIAEGRDLSSGDAQSSSALVASEYASEHGLSVGSPLDLNGAGFTVVGIFSASSCTSGGETIILPFSGASSVLGTNNATIVFAYLSGGANLGAEVRTLQGHLGSGYTVQSLANANHNALQAALSSILSGALFAEYAALATGALIIVIIMFVVTSHRTREFGLMKALGYGNRRILAQVSLESLLVAVAGLPMAIAVSLVLGPAIVQWAVGGAASGYVGQQLLSGGQFNLTVDLVVLGALVTVIFGLIGSVYPSVRALRLAPTEALRDE